MRKCNRVYKYRGGDNEEIFERDLKSLVNDEFFASTRENLNDPCEGFITKNVLMTQVNLMVENNPHIFDSMENVKNKLDDLLNHCDTSGIYSLSTDYLDELLWAHYANSHKGFCIEYDLNMLLKLHRETVSKPTELLYFDVDYEEQPYSLTVDDMNLISETVVSMKKLLGVKSKKWKYEDEYRIISSHSGFIKYDYRAVKSIYFALRMEEKQKHEIMRKLQGRGIQYYQIELKNNSYEFYETPVNDLYTTGEKYLYSIAQIEPCAITNIESHKYSQYYYKVAEIVRREPYCNSVLYVNCIYNNITEEEPIFEVSFFQKRPLLYKQSFTLKEIDSLYSKIDDL